MAPSGLLSLSCVVCLSVCRTPSHSGSYICPKRLLGAPTPTPWSSLFFLFSCYLTPPPVYLYMYSVLFIADGDS